MTSPLVLIGASGCGREFLDVVEAHNAARPEAAFDIVGVLDDGPSPVNLARLEQRGITYLGGVSTYVSTHAPVPYLVGIGAPHVRERLVASLDRAGWQAATVIHPDVIVGSQSHHRDGVVICAGAQVSTNVVLGRHVHIQPNATIGHDSILDDFASANPAAVVSGEVHVGRSVLVGAGAIILQGLTVGSGSVIGAGAVVTRDVPSDVVVKGIPGAWT